MPVKIHLTPLICKNLGLKGGVALIARRRASCQLPHKMRNVMMKKATKLKNW